MDDPLKIEHHLQIQVSIKCEPVNPKVNTSMNTVVFTLFNLCQIQKDSKVKYVLWPKLFIDFLQRPPPWYRVSPMMCVVL